jgi:glycosyltransferase involved in cell wall biosynthesis
VLILERIQNTDVSAVILTFNSERLLERVIRSVIGKVSKIVVVDSGSVDGTLNIASSYGCEIIKAKGDFSHLRNTGMEACVTPWVLMVDSDELVTEEVWEGLSGLDVEGVDAITCFRINYIDGKPCRFFSRNHVIRFLRRDKCVFEGPVHERPIFNGKTLALNASIHHFPYRDWEDYRVKILRYMSMEPKEASPVRIRKMMRHVLRNYLLNGAWLDGVTGLRLLVYSLYYQFGLMLRSS